MQKLFLTRVKFKILSNENLFHFDMSFGRSYDTFQFRASCAKRHKKCKIFENFQRPKMSQNVQFLVSNCENNVLHT